MSLLKKFYLTLIAMLFLQPSYHPLPVLAGKRHLPQPSGPHSVGFVDMMTSGGPREGSYMRILYPTAEQCLQGHERWPVWKDDKCLTGMLTFMQVNRL